MIKYILLLITLMLLGCATDVHVTEQAVTETYGWFSGLLHGWLSTIALIASIFSDEYVIYACNNTGFWYNFWYLIGVGGLFSSTKVVYKTRR